MMIRYVYTMSTQMEMTVWRMFDSQMFIWRSWPVSEVEGRRKKEGKRKKKRGEANEEESVFQKLHSSERSNFFSFSLCVISLFLPLPFSFFSHGDFSFESLKKEWIEDFVKFFSSEKFPLSHFYWTSYRLSLQYANMIDVKLCQSDRYNM